jgi:hypothetical protein
MQVINTGSGTVATWGKAVANEVDAAFLYYYHGTGLSEIYYLILYLLFYVAKSLSANRFEPF